jgi:hypothetical protein
MESTATPQVGQWYRELDKEGTFQVIDVDQESGTVQIQLFDGGLDSIDLEDWKQMQLESTAEPEDWTGALEDVEPDDVTEDDLPSDRK